jgi:hypothetical protein
MWNFLIAFVLRQGLTTELRLALKSQSYYLSLPSARNSRHLLNTPGEFSYYFYLYRWDEGSESSVRFLLPRSEKNLFILYYDKSTTLMAEKQGDQLSWFPGLMVSEDLGVSPLTLGMSQQQFFMLFQGIHLCLWTLTALLCFGNKHKTNIVSTFCLWHQLIPSTNIVVQV